MINHIGAFRAKLQAGQLCLGTGITLCDPAVVEALSPSVDFFWIDMEHNPIGIETLLGHLIAARAGGAPALVRVPGSESSFLKRVLDTGAEGIIVPQVRSADEVRQIVQTCRYQPLGNRGFGPRRPSDYGRRPLARILDEAQNDLFVSVQIENTDAINEIDEIATIEGIDSLVVGPFDLSASMGVIGELEHPEVMAKIETVIQKAHEAGLYVGVGDEALAESAVRWANIGADWIQCGGDFSYMIKMADQLFANIRAAI